MTTQDSSAARGPLTPSGADRGSVSVEFALLLPLFLAMLMGVFAASSAYQARIELSAAAQEAVRTYTLAYNGTNQAAAVTAARNAAKTAVSLSPAFLADPNDRFCGTTTSPCNEPLCSGAGTLAVVRLERQVPFDFLLGSFTLTLPAKAVMTCAG